MLINGHEGNEGDGLFKQIRDPLARQTILVDFNPLAGSKIGELTANFDIVLGVTVEELEDGTISGIGKPQRGGPDGRPGGRSPRP
jgi:protocatechuate 3,4-dioxygenase beta subunit